MKQILIVPLLFIFCFANVAAQTNANIAGPENVLVVYNSNSDTSVLVKNYYRDARNIPTTNICPLNYLTSHNINIDGVTHPVIIAEGGNIIRDSLNHEWGTWFASQHAWKYFYQYVATPIKEYLVNNNLTSSIRYIVLCKGVPYKIQAGADSGAVICNIGVDGLLCMLNTDSYGILLDSMYAKWRRHAVANYDWSDYGAQMVITNPYHDVSQYLNMNYRFKPGVYTRNWDIFTIKLDYLVSHLDGTSYDMVKNMIDLSSEAINSDNYDWFIDADPTPCHGGGIMVSFANAAASALSSIGFLNYSFDTTEDTVTYHNKPVISYSSNGVHTTKPPNTGEGQTLHPDYIQSQLNFDYAPGAIFNTAESFNAERLSSITRRPGAEMGQVVEFFLEGGTLAVGHPYEPFTTGLIEDGRMFPAYQLGYSFIDAAYLGLPYLAWQNVIVGDPLTTIAWGKQTTTRNIDMEENNLITDTITISDGDTLFFGDGATILLKHNGFIESDGYGVLLLKGTATVTSDSWSRGLLLADYQDHPQLVWSDYPTGPSNFYKIYKKLDAGAWQYVDSVRGHSWIDNSLTYADHNGQLPNHVYYYVKLNGTLSSNTVDAEVYKSRGKILPTTLNEIAYKLEQNYPNPFNPVTTINYSIKNDGFVSLKIYNILGQQVADLVNQNQRAGYYNINFNAADLPSGVYIYTISTSGFTSSKKMLLIK